MFMSILSPGIHLINRLQYPQKLALIGILTSLSVALIYTLPEVYLVRVLAFVVWILGIYLLAAFYVATKQSVSNLREISQRLASGDWVEKGTFDAHDELGQIAQTLDTVSKRLRNSWEQIELESERTNAAEILLREGEERIRAIFDTSLDAIITINADGLITGWNRQAEIIFGWSHQEAMGQGLSSLIIPQEYRTAHENGLKHFLATGVGPILNNRVEITALHRDGRKFPVELSTAATKLREGYTFSAFVRDITERTQAEQVLKQKNDELEKTLEQLRETQKQLIMQENLASLGTLTAGIVHEIKNPLGFVSNFAELSADLTTELREELDQQKNLLDSKTFENIKDILNILEQNVLKTKEHSKRADNIIRNMLVHSRGQVGERKPTDINALLADYVKLAYHGFRAKDSSFNITLQTEYDPSIGLVEVVQQDISRVFLNIINNACYAVHQKKKESGREFSPTLWVSTKNQGALIEVRIRDNGIGIPSTIVDKIFNPFFTTKPSGEGTGLGLSISYDIVVQGHGGEIKVETEEGSYTEFSILLPKKGI
jgi:PAS domain S-box-containing protein